MKLLGKYSPEEIQAAIKDGAAYVTIQGFDFRILNWEPDSHIGSVASEIVEYDCLTFLSEQIDIKED